MAHPARTFRGAFSSLFYSHEPLCYNGAVVNVLARRLLVSLGDALMNKTIHAIFEKGVFRPLESIDLPEKSKVEFELKLADTKVGWPEGYFQQTAGAFADDCRFHRRDDR